MVVAPSMIPRKSGDRQKNDKRDAASLAAKTVSDENRILHEPPSTSNGADSHVRCNGVTDGWIALALSNALDLWTATARPDAIRRNLLAILAALDDSSSSSS